MHGVDGFAKQAGVSSGDYLMAVDGIRVNCIDEVMEALSNNTGLQVVQQGPRRPASQPTSKGTKVSGMPSSSTPRGDLTSGKTPATQLHTSSSAANGRNRRSLRPRIKGSDKSTLPRISLPNGHASCTDSDDSLFEVDDSDYDGSSAGSDSDDSESESSEENQCSSEDGLDDNDSEDSSTSDPFSLSDTSGSDEDFAGSIEEASKIVKKAKWRNQLPEKPSPHLLHRLNCLVARYLN